ncbi:MAG TPA: ATPase, T2SS/T4P/T4SS family [Kofleriaceae bacterium]|jgi:twitching motility protein PilT
MAKIDVYLRSIERFGAAGAVLASGQAVTMRFPTGDRHATQVTQHDQLVAIVREVAPPAAVAQLDKQQPVRFEIESGGIRYGLVVQPKPGAWQVAIEPASAAAAPAAPAASTAPVAVIRVPRAQTAQPQAPDPPRAPTEIPDELPIERGQYGAEALVAARSGSTLLDQLTHAARQARASDVYLATGTAPLMRVGGELQPLGDQRALDQEMLSRELGVVAPADARAAWLGRGLATFAYGDGMGRVRATLVRDHRGPGASLRLLVGEAPALDRLGVPREVAAWLDQRGLVLVAGASGAGKTTALAALVRAIAERRRRVIVFEDAIEIVHASPLVSQRALGEHVPGMAAAVAAALREAPDAIALGATAGAQAALAAIDAAAAGHLVLAAVAVAGAHDAAHALVEQVPPGRRDFARAVVERGLIGTLAPVVTGASRSFEVVVGRVEHAS